MLRLSHGHLREPTVTTLCRNLMEMKEPAQLISFQYPPEPGGLVRGLQKRVIAVNGRVLALHDILDFADCFAGDIPDSLDVLRHE